MFPDLFPFCSLVSNNVLAIFPCSLKHLGEPQLRNCVTKNDGKSLYREKQLLPASFWISCCSSFSWISALSYKTGRNHLVIGKITTILTILVARFPIFVLPSPEDFPPLLHWNETEISDLAGIKDNFENTFTTLLFFSFLLSSSSWPICWHSWI